MAEIRYFIRAATEADVPAVDDLLRRCYPQLLKADYPPSVLVTAVPLIARAQPGLVGCGTYYVADAGEHGIIGAGGWTLHDPASAPPEAATGNIRHFVTEPLLLRKGVGHRLMERSIADASAAGLRAMQCHATRTAVPFYAAEGFEALGEVDIELRPGITFPAVRMRRRLR
ncbi:GNAT family N-acetyltransferase [Rhodobacteraceae bacterium 2CG4]|uniref:GNAT family N-acetyltransferase n=1 Tax=Halovulum marinum TaxID=2662447 RepID=A0A6L5YX99_9RHOB|nr:GNAT family N-acetyltransferase [Halovulum marinum]MSU88294.1 GNAT family N-acetyltransferase [Halovulum marinum]